MSENMPKPPALLVPNHSQYAASFCGTYPRFFVFVHLAMMCIYGKICWSCWI